MTSKLRGLMSLRRAYKELWSLSEAIATTSACTTPCVSSSPLVFSRSFAKASSTSTQRLRDVARSIDKDEGLRRVRALKEDLRDAAAIEDVVRPPTPRQVRYSARLEEALNLGFEKYHEARDDLVRRYGFTIKQVRVSADLKSAFVQWAVFEGKEEEAAIMLRKVERRVVDIAFKKYASWTFPKLIWRTQEASEVAKATERAFDALVSAEEEDALFQVLARMPGGSAARADTLLRTYKSEGTLSDAMASTRRRLGSDLSAALQQLEREQTDLERRRIEGMLGSVTLRPTVRAKLLERLRRLEDEGVAAGPGLGESSFGAGVEAAEAAREDALLAAVEGLEEGDRVGAIREELEFREFIEEGESEVGREVPRGLEDEAGSEKTGPRVRSDPESESRAHPDPRPSSDS